MWTEECNECNQSFFFITMTILRSPSCSLVQWMYWSGSPELHLILTLAGSFWRKKKILLETLVPCTSLKDVFIAIIAPRLLTEDYVCLGLCAMNDELHECFSFTVAGGRNYDFLCSCKRAARGGEMCYIRSWKTVRFLLAAGVVKCAHSEAVLGFCLS